MFHCLSESQQGLFQGDVHCHEQIIIDALEDSVCCLLNHKDDVTLNHVCSLLALSLKPNRVRVFLAWLHNYEEIFRFTD